MYEINKGINRPIEFRGFRAQYVTYLAIALVGLLLVFAIGYMIGVSSIFLLIMVGGGGFILISWIYKLSHTYGEFGLMKAVAFTSIPSAIVCRSRKPLLILKSKGGKE